MKMNIKTRLLRNFVLVISISVSIVSIAIVLLLSARYYKDLELNLTKQVKESANLYNTNYSHNLTIEESIQRKKNKWFGNTKAQVQIIDTKKNELYDSLGTDNKTSFNTKDISSALKGKMGVWTGSMSHYHSSVMCISYPLKSKKNIVGVIRFISSTEGVKNQINNIILIFFIFGVIVVTIVAVISIFLSNSITKPIEELTQVAKKMAEGDFTCRCEKPFDDEIGRLADTLNYMADEIIKKENDKNDFLSQVSHELRTPLTIIKGWSSTLKYGADSDNKMLIDGLNMIEDESDRLTDMVEELLDFSKLLSGKEKLKYEYVQIEEILKSVEEMMKNRVIRDKLRFEVNWEENLPNINLDKNKIKQVIINLLDNAFNFTEKNGLVIISARRENDYIIVKVEDNGCGISENDMLHIKEKFYKGRTSKSKNGLGLSICDEIIKLHGGQLDIRNADSKGTLIQFSIPII